jgi:hypothetical protein
MCVFIYEYIYIMYSRTCILCIYNEAHLQAHVLGLAVHRVRALHRGPIRRAHLGSRGFDVGCGGAQVKHHLAGGVASHGQHVDAAGHVVEVLEHQEVGGLRHEVRLVDAPERVRRGLGGQVAHLLGGAGRRRRTGGGRGGAVVRLEVLEDVGQRRHAHTVVGVGATHHRDARGSLIGLRNGLSGRPGVAWVQTGVLHRRSNARSLGQDFVQLLSALLRSESQIRVRVQVVGVLLNGEGELVLGGDGSGGGGGGGHLRDLRGGAAHLHHRVGGLRFLSESGSWVPTFPRTLSHTKTRI